MMTTFEKSVVRPLPVQALCASTFSVSIYGDPSAETEDLLPSIRELGVLVPLVVAKNGDGPFEIISGHRRHACAQILGHDAVPCQVVRIASAEDRRRAVLEYNRQRRKTFSQMMREASALEILVAAEARRRQWDNLAQNQNATESRNSDSRAGRTDSSVAKSIGLGGKDLYRQARAIWKAAEGGDIRAKSGVESLDAGTKTIHAAYKDLRRRDKFTAGFKPTPYDVWHFRRDHAFGIPHPGSIPPSIVAHTLFYYSPPDGLVVDPMAGGGTTIDVCQAMGRRCLAYDLHPARSDVHKKDVTDGYTPESNGCDLVFADPPYHTMKAGKYPGTGIGDEPLSSWTEFLSRFAHHSFAVLKPGGHIALLLANQSERDIPAGVGYIDHAFLGYNALIAAGFVPERRISCPMDGAFTPQQVRRARTEGRMLGQVRDLLVMRKPSSVHAPSIGSPPASS